ncbi:MAG: ABC transporter permease [Anaerolineales bacterium]|nr:ABC transporter permease [Chloroflexota bacterium]MBL6983497.1 ABC transporter permease [Anaerolineales bacterium]
MIFKNLLRRKGRTILTALGIAIGVAAIVGLGALANGLAAGYDSFLTGSKADLILSQPDAFDVSMSTVDESISQELEDMSEVLAVSGMLEGMVQAEQIPLFFVFGYPEDSFILGRFNIIEGAGLDSREVINARGKPMLLGSGSAEALNKKVGDTLRIQDRVFRIVGIYETGATLEDNGAVLPLRDAQELLGRLRQVSIVYIQLKDPGLQDRVQSRVERRWSDLSLSTTDDFADKQMMGDIMKAFVWVIAGLAIVIGGVGMMNAQLMAVVERTREIGVLRSVGWKRGRILRMILGESIIVGLIGGIFGIALGWFMISYFEDFAGFFGASKSSVTPEIIQQALLTVVVLGFVGGAYPAWRASRMPPIEALRYEGGTSGSKARRLPIGGMAVQSLWQRSARTLLTLGVIAITVGGIIALEAAVSGMMDTFAGMSADSEIMVRQAGVADTEYSALDERVGDKIAAFPEVAHVSGMAFSGTVLPDSGAVFIMLGYAPNEYAIRQFNIVEGERISTNRQIMLGSMMAEAMNLSVGDSLELSSRRFKVVGIYESGVTWQEMGGVSTLRDAQNFMGRPHKVGMMMVKVHDPQQAEAVVAKINTQIPDAHASLSGEFAQEMPDMANANAMLGSISFLAIFVGGVGVLNTMLMAVMERTREIGVFRALGWRRWRILRLIITEALILGLLGGLIGIGLAFVFFNAFNAIPIYNGMLSARWELDIFLRAIAVALGLGLLGGIYPAFRATRLQPVEALRYE